MLNREDISKIVSMQKQHLHRLFYKKTAFKEQDQAIKATFASEQTATSKFQQLVSYFWQAHQHYCSNNNTLAYYPGLQSIYGHRNDGIEGVSRLMPLWAAYCNSPYASDEDKQNMLAHLQQVFTYGTNPNHKSYWGDINDRSTLICEGADIALAIWLIKKQFIADFAEPLQLQILTWLKQAVGKSTADNNWHLFVVLIDMVITDLDEHHIFSSQERYQKIKSFYVDSGCFRDGERGEIDLYNAWAFHYGLYWIDQIDATFDREFIRQAANEYSDWYKYLFTEQGMPLFGRSLCYKMAAPVPILMSAEYSSEVVKPEEALNILLSCWQYFIKNDALTQGRPSQGVFADDELWLDPYSGPASSFWATRSLVLMYYQSNHIGWQHLSLLPLPANSKIERHVAGANMTISTDPQAQSTKVIFNDFNHQLADVVFKKMSLKDRIKQAIFAVAHRPANNLLKQKVREYHSNLNEYRTP